MRQGVFLYVYLRVLQIEEVELTSDIDDSLLMVNFQSARFHPLYLGQTRYIRLTVMKR